MRYEERRAQLQGTINSYFDVKESDVAKKILEVFAVTLSLTIMQNLLKVGFLAFKRGTKGEL